MQIECKLKRPGGTKADIGGVTYHFKPANPNDPNSPDLCDVKDKFHAQRFLGIAEAYCLPGDAPMAIAPEPVAPPQAPAPASVAAEETPLEDKSDEELRSIIKEVTGRTPHPNTSREKLIAKIRGEDDGE